MVARRDHIDHISYGSVIHNPKFTFEDGTEARKYFIIITEKQFESKKYFVLSTSQLKYLQNEHFANEVINLDNYDIPASVFPKETLINVAQLRDIEYRCTTMEKLLDKLDSGEFEYVGKLPIKCMSDLKQKIQDSVLLSEEIKLLFK